MKNLTKTLIVLLAGGLALGTQAVRAAPVTIDNPSFEDDVLMDGQATVDTIIGWSGDYGPTYGFGAFNPTSDSYTGAGGNMLPPLLMARIWLTSITWETLFKPSPQH